MSHIYLNSSYWVKLTFSNSNFPGLKIGLHVSFERASFHADIIESSNLLLLKKIGLGEKVRVAFVLFWFLKEIKLS